MDHMYDKITSSSSSSVSAPVACSASATDEISLFLQQILVRSSSSPSSASENLNRLCRSQLVGERISAVDSSGGYLAANTTAANLSSSSVGASENENDEYDCDSEEGQELEALVEEVPAKSLNARTSSKRSRAAEVHNLSEKRRRSRINEKMKALQNLIPNSNKTDKASMLDEAIEYLKQLQLQVQMLAMRNGLSLHPISLPSSGLQPVQLSQMRMDFGEENRPLHTNMTGTFPLNQETSTPNAFAVPNQSTSSNQQLVPNMLNIISSETTLGLDLPIQAPLGAFPLQSSAQGLCKEDRIRNQETNINHSETDFEMEAIAALAAFNRQASNIKGDNFVEACITEGDWSQSGLLRVIEHSLILPSNLHGSTSMRTGFTGRSDPKDDIKVERANL